MNYRKKHNDSLFKCSFENCSLISECQSNVREKFNKIDTEIPPPEEIFTHNVKPQYTNDIFPLPNLTALNKFRINR